MLLQIKSTTFSSNKRFFLTLIFSKPIALKPIMWFVWFMNWEWASSKIALCGRCTVVNPSATAF